MSEFKERRQRAVAELIRSQRPSSQDELAERLAGLGFAVTQATISRDLEQLGAVKMRRDGKVSYALPDQLFTSAASDSKLGAIFRDWVHSIEVAGNLIVIKTPPGSAHLVGVALDQCGLAEVVGTVCGDDTIFVACRMSSHAKALAARLEALWPDGH